jgi:hypothetical protein
LESRDGSAASAELTCFGPLGTLAGMKRKLTLLLLLLLFSLTLGARAAEQIAYYTGAWYATKAATPADREAGEIDYYFYDDGYLYVEIFYNGSLVATGEGEFFEISPYLWKLYFYDSDDWYYWGQVKFGFLSGKFVGAQNGKMQAN